MSSTNSLHRKGIEKFDGSIDLLVGLKADLQRVLESLGKDPEYDRKSLAFKIGQLGEIIDGLSIQKGEKEIEIFDAAHEKVLLKFNRKMMDISEAS